jgi:hypothetical protein
VETSCSARFSEVGGGEGFLESDAELDGCWGSLARATLLTMRGEVKSVDDGERTQSPALM